MVVATMDARPRTQETEHERERRPRRAGQSGTAGGPRADALRVGRRLAGSAADDPDLLRKVRPRGPAACAALRGDGTRPSGARCGVAGRGLRRPAFVQRALRRLRPHGLAAHRKGAPRRAACPLGPSALQVRGRRALPTDPEWRAAFVAYLEWGSRIALENSQPGAHPPPNMPVPRWSWVCDATPGSRVSALAKPTAQQEEADLPGAEEPVSFAQHIKPLFREGDRRSMRFAFDLWSHEEVATHAPAILDRLRTGTMPCDGAWPKDRVAVFERWLDSGKAA